MLVTVRKQMLNAPANMSPLPDAAVSVVVAGGEPGCCAEWTFLHVERHYDHGARLHYRNLRQQAAVFNGIATLDSSSLAAAPGGRRLQAA